MLRKAQLAIAMLAVLPAAAAQEHIADLKHSLRIEYQYVRSGSIDFNDDQIDLGRTDTHVYILSGVYSLNDRWKIFGSIPYVQKRHKGALAHDPNVDFFAYTPPDLRVVDDGAYHGDFQDIYVGTQFLAVDGPLSVSPYISFGTPMSDYPIYGNAIIGKQVWEVPVGVTIGFTPYFSDWSFEADISYVFSEEVIGVNLDYWLLHAAARYYITPRFAPRVFLTQRIAPHALGWDDFREDADWDTEAGFHHDRLLRHAYLNGGIGIDYVVSDRYSISATYYETIDQDIMANIDSAFTFALTRRF
ncbi:MAG: hypothetical protein KJO31_09895 [Gammaproteobacteria bacterium]|nr:hypothetical protein [Gammaproteobacteria bacterium]